MAVQVATGAPISAQSAQTQSTPSATSSGGLQPLTPQLFQSLTANTPNPDPSGKIVSLDPFTGDPGSLGGSQGNVFGSNTFDYSLDPFLFKGMKKEKAAFQSQTGESFSNTSQDPGFQQFGQSYLDLLNTIGTQNLQWGGINDPTYDFAHGLKGQGHVTDFDTNNLVKPWNSGNQEQAYANSVDFVSKNFGLDPNSKQAQKLGGAYLEYTLQNQNLYQLNKGEHASREGKDLFGSILGILTPVTDVVAAAFPALAPVAVAANLANAGENFSQGNLLGGFGSIVGAAGGGLSALADPASGLSNALDITDTAAAVGPSTAADAATLGNLATAANVAKVVGGGLALGQGIASNNPLGIAGGAISLGSPALSLLQGTSSSPLGVTSPNGVENTANVMGVPIDVAAMTGTDAVTAGSTLSSISDTSSPVASSGSGGFLNDIQNALGIDDSTLSDIENAAEIGIPLAGSGALAANLLSGSGGPSSSTQPTATTKSPSATDAPTFASDFDAAGNPLSPIFIENPAQRAYQQFLQQNTTFSNEQLAGLLLTLGLA